jgi:hypothetical protein
MLNCQTILTTVFGLKMAIGLVINRFLNSMEESLFRIGFSTLTQEVFSKLKMQSLKVKRKKTAGGAAKEV